MALHAKAAGWEVETYWQPDHPCQQLAREVVAAVSGVPVRQIGTATDGCGVVSFAIPLTAAARAYAHLADPSSLSATKGVEPALIEALTRIRDAMLAYPELISGDRRQFDTDLMRAAPARLVAKGGAEGLRCVGLLPDALGPGKPAVGVAVKIEDGDGSRRAGPVATCEALRQIGFLGEAEMAALEPHASPSVLDMPRGEVVGAVRPVFTLEMAGGR